jgi:branched-chain amino acid aminotransferase
MLELLTGASVDLAHSAARHGAGLFETIRIRDGVPRRLEAHLERLTLGAAFLGMAPPPPAEAVRAFLARHTSCPTLDCGVLRLVAVDGQLHVTIAPWAPEEASPTLVAVSRQGRRFSGSPLNWFKTLSYLENLLLTREAARRHLFEVIALNEAGRLTDGGRTTLFLVLDGELLTPAVADGALPGVARRVLLEAGLAREAHLEPGALARVEAALLTNALRGALPVHGLEGRALATGHPLLAEAAALLEA